MAEGFGEVLAAAPEPKWNSLLCGVTIDNGSFYFSPTLDFSLHKQLPGCCLTFLPIKRYLHDSEFESDEEYDCVFNATDAHYLSLLMTAWEQVRGDPSIQAILSRRPVPLRVVNSPEDVPPLVETVLE